MGQFSGIILEIGPGYANRLSRFDGTAVTRVYGVEANDSLVDELRRELVKYPDLSKVYVPIQGSFQDDTLLKSYGTIPGNVDTIVGVQVPCCVMDLTQAVEQVHRLLKPGGQLIFWEHQKSNDTVTRWFQ